MATAEEVWPYLATLIKNRAPEAEKMHSYYQGEQDLPLDVSQLKSKFGVTFAEFRDNLARPIIDSAETRIRIQDIDNADAVEVWRRNELEAESKLVHTDALVMGRAYVIVLPDDDGEPGVYPQISTSCAILYDPDAPRKKLAAMKFWQEEIINAIGAHEDRVRVNIYFEDRIERYQSKKKATALEVRFDAYEPIDDDWISYHPVSEVPMFEFRANFDETTQETRSDLADAASIIDAINKTFLDMMTASEYTAAPQRWATGVEIPLDPTTGEPLQSYQSGADQLWTATNESARFGQFEPGQLSAYKAAIDELVDHLVFVSRTPKYALAGESKYSSGESLRVIENPLRSRVSDHQQTFTSSWQRVLAAALRIKPKTEEVDFWDIRIRWLPANAPFATTERLEEMKLKVETLGIPQEQAWREMGYTQDEIDEMKIMRDEEIALGFDTFDAAATAALGAQPPPPGVGEAPPAVPPAPAPPGGLAPEV